jgi:hypothetical protein
MLLPFCSGKKSIVIIKTFLLNIDFSDIINGVTSSQGPSKIFDKLKSVIPLWPHYFGVTRIGLKASYQNDLQLL